MYVYRDPAHVYKSVKKQRKTGKKEGPALKREVSALERGIENPQGSLYVSYLVKKEEITRFKLK